MEKMYKRTLIIVGVFYCIWGIISGYSYIFKYFNILLVFWSIFLICIGIGIFCNNKISLKMAKIIAYFFTVIFILGLVLPGPDSPWRMGVAFKKFGYVLVACMFLAISILLTFGADKKKQGIK